MLNKKGNRAFYKKTQEKPKPQETPQNQQKTNQPTNHSNTKPEKNLFFRILESQIQVGNLPVWDLQETLWHPVF